MEYLSLKTPQDRVTVEVGDVILKVNETDVIRFNTKEVLKCLRLSSDPVTLKIKRGRHIKVERWGGELEERGSLKYPPYSRLSTSTGGPLAYSYSILKSN
ncbi:hypothetical protein NQ317_005938 [Molorchus minor]|uniref:PDZ domain-containing protein n=1 Tax=Molorchus minor TaxID=1323400 RepID=A0ABQ9J9V1_9CUCU|nr:hypothetical protein NQ317_005938 [Molorchus minor]